MVNINTGKKRIKIPRIVRMHAADMHDVESAVAGDIVALFGVECASGDTFTNGEVQYTMTSMHVPAAVMSLSVSPKLRDSTPNFSKALNRFSKEDPTFRVWRDEESNETLIAGMGELHLEIYIERMKREYQVDVNVGKPQVAYRETITKKPSSTASTRSRPVVRVNTPSSAAPSSLCPPTPWRPTNSWTTSWAV